jgi:hypothetical protein
MSEEHRREDNVISRYNQLMRHALKTEGVLEDTLARYNVTVSCLRKEVEGLHAQLEAAKKDGATSAVAVEAKDGEVKALRLAVKSAEERESSVTLAVRDLEEKIAQREEELTFMEERYNLLLFQVRERGGRENAKLLREHREQREQREQHSRDHSPQVPIP